MNCPMRLGLSKTTCPQRLREQNPVKVVFVLYDSEPSRSYSHLCPLFLLVNHVYSFLLKKLKIQYFMAIRFYCPSRFFGLKGKVLGTLPFNPWAVLATWLHLGAPKKVQEK
jgi:hypothetical protein